MNKNPPELSTCFAHLHPKVLPSGCLFKGRIAPLPHESNPYLQNFWMLVFLKDGFILTSNITVVNIYGLI